MATTEKTIGIPEAILKASNMKYDNTASGLAATNAQAALDEIKAATDKALDVNLYGSMSGSVVAANDSADNELIEVTAYGKSVQNTYSGKNLLEIQAETPTTTTSGITFTINENKSISVSGASTERATRQLGSFELKAGSYILSQGYISKGNSVCIFLAYKDENGTVKYIDLFTNTEGVIGFTLTTDTTVTASVDVRNANMTISNVTLYPMLRKASITDATYEPFVGGEVSPNPSFPQSITSVADDKSLVVKSVGKNLLENTATTQTINGITFTVNSNGSVTANGTATAVAQMSLGKVTIENTDVILSDGGVRGSSAFSFVHGYKNGVATYTVASTSNGECKFTNNYDELLYGIYIKEGQTLNNVVFYPMIRDASVEDDTYEPYISTEVALTLTDSLRGIPVESGGNYTDESGQSWICDTIEKYADGTGKLIRRVYHKVFDGTESFKSMATGKGYYFALADNKIKINEATYNLTGAMCNKLVEVTPDALWQNDKDSFSMGTTENTFRLRFTSLTNVTSVASIQAQLKAWYDAGEPMELICELAEPIEISLTANQLLALMNLQSFNPYTTVYTYDIGDIKAIYHKNGENAQVLAKLVGRVQTTAAVANTRANSALSSANEAIVTANEAQDTAEAAKANAATAVNAANSANSTAGAANSTANQAKNAVAALLSKYALVEGDYEFSSSTQSHTISYPDGFTSSNCVVISAMFYTEFKPSDVTVRLATQGIVISHVTNAAVKMPVKILLYKY